MADIRSQPEQDSGVERTLKTILLGDFYKNPTFTGLTVRAAISAVPGVDQLADVQDTAAWVVLARDEGLENPEVRLNGLLLSIGWIPLVGAAGKLVLNTLSNPGATKSVVKLLDHLNFLGQGNGVKWLKEFATDLPAYAKQAADKMQAVLDELHSLLGKLKELVPDKLVLKLSEWQTSVAQIRDQIHEMFAETAEGLKKQLDEALGKFEKKELDLPSATKTEINRVQDAAPPPGSSTARQAGAAATKEPVKVINPELKSMYGEKDALSYELDPDTMVYRFEPADVPTPMQPHPTMYERPGYEFRYDYLYVVEKDALPDLEALRKSQGYFDQPTVLRSARLGDLMDGLGPNARVLEDSTFNFSVLGGERKGALAIVKPK